MEFAQTNASHPWLPTRRYGITQGYQSVVLFGGELPDTDGRELPGSADLPSERCSLVLVGEMGAGRHEALLYSLTGDHVYKVLYGRFGLRLGNLFVVKVLDNFNRRVRFSSERGYGGLVVEVLGISIPAAGPYRLGVRLRSQAVRSRCGLDECVWNTRTRPGSHFAEVRLHPD